MGVIFGFQTEEPANATHTRRIHNAVAPRAGAALMTLSAAAMVVWTIGGRLAAKAALPFPVT